MAGSGTLSLAGTDSYSGSTAVGSGTLAVASGGSLSSGPLSVGSASATASLTLNGNFTGTQFSCADSLPTTNTVSIGSGWTLAITGNVNFGSTTGLTTNATFTGLGSFVVGSTVSPASSFFVGSTVATNTTLNMSSLSTFTADLSPTTGTFIIGDSTGTAVNPGQAIVTLAAVSTITANAVEVGDIGDSGATQTLDLGSGLNTIYTNLLTVGPAYSTGVGTNSNGTGGTTGTNSIQNGLLQFSTMSGSLTLQGTGGSSSPVAYVGIGNVDQNTSASGGNGTVNLAGHSANLNITNLDLSDPYNSFHATTTAAFTFGSGTLAVGTLTLGTTDTHSTAEHPTVNVTINGGTNAIGTLLMGGYNNTGTPAGSILTSTLTLNGGTTTVSGNITTTTPGTGNVTKASIVISGGILDVGGNAIGTNATPIPLTLDSGVLQNVSQINGGAAVTVTIASSLPPFTLAGTNSFTGGTTVINGILVAGSPDGLPKSKPLSVASGATFQLNGNRVTLGTLTGSGTISNGSGSAGSLNIAVPSYSSSTFTGNLIDGTVSAGTPAPLSLTTIGPGTLTLTGMNTFSGGIAVSSGVLVDGFASAIPNDDALNVASGATFELNGYGVTLSALTGSGAVSNSSSTSGGKLTISVASGMTTFGGTLADGTPASGTPISLALNVSGPGSTILSGTESYSGPTAIDSGYLAISTPGLVAAGSTVTVGTGSTLGGNGTVGGPVTVNGTLTAAGVFSPGIGGTGILSTGNVSFNSGGIFAAAIAGFSGTGTAATPGTDFDQVASNGTVNLSNAALNVTLADGFTPAPGESFTIMTAASPILNNFTYEGVSALDESTITINGQPFTIHYNLNGADDVVLTALSAAPTLASVSPNSAPVDSASPVTITLTGTNFDSTASVLFNGTAISTTYVNAAQVTALIPVSDLTTAGTDTLTETTDGGTTSKVPFNVLSAAPTYFVGNISQGQPPSPNSAPTGSTSPVTITLTGTGFDSSSTIFFNGAALSTHVLSTTSLKATIPVADLAVTANDSLTVATSDTSVTSQALTFPVVPAVNAYVQNPNFNLAGSQRSLVDTLTYVFSTSVSLASLSSGAFTLSRQSDGLTITSIASTKGEAYINVSNPSGDNETFVLTLVAPTSNKSASVVQNGSLADGVYQLNVNHTVVAGCI